MTCAKRKVTCVIVSDLGFAMGDNRCDAPQTACPRLEGEGYEKCKSVCEQEGHAEIVALKSLGGSAPNGVAYLSGHDHFCGECVDALFDAGVRNFIIVGRSYA